MLARSPEPEAHDKVLDNNPDRIGIWKCWFLRRGRNRNTRRKTSRSKEENQQKTQPKYDTGTGNRTRNTLVRGERSNHCTIPALQSNCGSLNVAYFSSAIILNSLNLSFYQSQTITLDFNIDFYESCFSA